MPAARKGEPAAGKVDRDTCASWPAVRVSLRVAPSGACTAGGDTGGWGTQWSFKRGLSGGRLWPRAVLFQIAAAESSASLIFFKMFDRVDIRCRRPAALFKSCFARV
jgi:hypothetical protein